MCSSYRDLSAQRVVLLDLFYLVEMSCNRDSESDRVFPLEGISFIDRESL